MRKILGGAGLLLSAALLHAEQVIFDTDSGIFGDDGAALIMLLHSQQSARILGITVVPGNEWTQQGVAYMLHILKLSRHNGLAVYAGAHAPLIHTAEMADVEHRDFGPVDYRGAFEKKFPAPRNQKQDGIRFIIDAIENQPGQVTILALGPMTNIAIALRMRPDLETKIKRIIWMGGNLRVPGNSTAAAEFNLWFDPEAARIVFRSRIPEKIMFGLDACNKSLLNKVRFDAIVAVPTPITELFRQDFGERYPGFLKNPTAEISMWDALVSAYVIDPKVVTKSETLYLDVDTRFGKTYGAVIPLDRRLAQQATPVQMVVDVDDARAWELYRTLLTR
jgi:inosine-uridine nucleoside N-ribohydrolase